MRTRRQLLKIGGAAALVGVSGCLEEVPEEEDGNETDDGGDGNETSDGGETDGGMNGNETDSSEDGNETDTDTDTDEEPATASFEVASVDAPSTVEIGQTVNWSVTVVNTGEAEGSFEATVTRTRSGNEEDIETVSLNLAAGEERSYSSSVSHDYVGDYVYSVGDTGQEFTVTAELRSLSFGQTYVNPDDVSVTVSGFRDFYDMELTRSYSYENVEGDSRIERASEDSKFAVISVESRKDSRDVVVMPRREEFTLFTDDDAYEPVDRLADDEYQGGETRSRSMSGVIMFEVDESLNRGDSFEVYWTRDYEEGRVEVIWST